MPGMTEGEMIVTGREPEHRAEGAWTWKKRAQAGEHRETGRTSPLPRTWIG